MPNVEDTTSYIRRKIAEAHSKNSTSLDLTDGLRASISLAELEPEILGELQFVQELKIIGLYSNLQKQLIAFPEWITQLTQLTTLDLSGNKIGEISEAITRLTQLTTLNLNGNNIGEIPEAITQLTQLTTLDLIRNNIVKIPEVVLNIVNLQSLDVDENPIETPPLEIAKQGIEAMRQFYRQRSEAGIDELFEAKLIIVGEPGAGKTSLARKILNSGYKLNPNEESTTGIDVSTWRFPFNNANMRVSIWDFGGQEIYHSTHQFFLTKRSVYAVVADTRKEDTDLHYWLNIIELLSDKSPVILIENEKQDRTRDIDEKQLRAEFSELRAIYRTNLMNGRGLDEINKRIKAEITMLPHIGAKLPKTWVRVREALEQDDRNYITADEFFTICDRNGFHREEDRLQLSEYLHDLGVCLHFQSDPVLKHVVILRPTWGTEAVYRILDDKKTIDNHGRFTRKDLNRILNEAEYRGMHDEILHLMLNFKLCYHIEGSASFIAPQLLPATQANYDWDTADNLQLRYEYQFAPKGIITQFIVAMHTLIKDQEIVWKSGVVLEKNEAFAEIIERYNKRELTVHISGKRQKELLSIVAHELDKIHSSFKHLQFKKLIPCNCEKCRISTTPKYYDEAELYDFLDARELIKCSKSFKMVNPRDLIDEPAYRRRSNPWDDFGAENDQSSDQRNASSSANTDASAEKPMPTSTTGPTRILHICDLHFTAETPFSARLQWLLADLKELNAEAIDFLVVSGDFNDKHQEGGFDTSLKFLIKLREKLGLAANQCILVPGNHDVDEPEDAYVWKRSKAGWNDSEWVEDRGHFFARNPEQYPLRFKLFNDKLYEQFMGFPYPMEFEEQGLVTSSWRGDFGIQFLALNSCWQIDEFDRKRSGILPAAVAHALDQADSQKKAALVAGEIQSDALVLRIGIWHHAFAGPNQMKDTTFIGNLQKAGVSLGLHGDVHELRRDLVGYWLDDKKMHIAGSGSFGSPHTGLPEATPRLYNLIEIDPGLKSATIHTREQRTIDGAWQGWHEWPTEDGKARVPFYRIEW